MHSNGGTKYGWAPSNGIHTELAENGTIQGTDGTDDVNEKRPDHSALTNDLLAIVRSS